MIAEEAGRLAPRRQSQLFGLLIGATATEGRSGAQVLCPLWADELMHRAYNMLRLCQMSECDMRGDHDDRLDSNMQFALARDLAAQYRSLVGGAEYEIVPCSAILRRVVVNLVELF